LAAAAGAAAAAAAAAENSNVAVFIGGAGGDDGGDPVAAFLARFTVLDSIHAGITPLTNRVAAVELRAEGAGVGLAPGAGPAGAGAVAPPPAGGPACAGRYIAAAITANMAQAIRNRRECRFGGGSSDNDDAGPSGAFFTVGKARQVAV